jgi:hypothetical protein
MASVRRHGNYRVERWGITHGGMSWAENRDFGWLAVCRLDELDRQCVSVDLPGGNFD